jgi:alkylated DNA repair dioxygenase AlkB
VQGPRTATHEIDLERRSAYLMTGESREGYEHHIPAVARLRYSVTFRTVRS